MVIPTLLYILDSILSSELFGCHIQDLVMYPHTCVTKMCRLTYVLHKMINSSPPGQNDRHFTDDILRCIFVNEKFYILIKISLKFVPKGLIDNKPVLVQINAWRRIGDALTLS